MTPKETTLQNLRIIYEQLPMLADLRPEIRAEFDMGAYGVLDDLTKNEVSKNICNTYGCGLGWSALLFDCTDDNLYIGYCKLFSYVDFSKKYFPILNTDCFKNLNWFFLFGYTWVEYQPTFDQFIERVKYFLDCNGDLPEWEYQTESFIKA